jgi:hypothetical protein
VEAKGEKGIGESDETRTSLAEFPTILAKSMAIAKPNAMSSPRERQALQREGDA